MVYRVFLTAALLSMAWPGSPAVPAHAQTAPAASAAPAAPAASAAPAGAAARVGDEIISMEDVEKPLRARLAQLERQRFELLQQRVDQLVADRLLAQEAARRSITTEQLLKEEVYSRAPQVSDDEVTTFMTENRSRLPQGDEAELKLKVWDYLRAQKVAQARAAYVETLRARTPVTIYLQEPAATRVAVDASKGFSRGPADAPVVIVEFSDFQCPFCKNVVATVKQVLADYPDKVRWVFRDFPLVSLHPSAPKAHEAARCAADQNRFWEYHDLLFERSPRHTPAMLKKYAEDLKLDTAAFAACLDSGRHAAAVQADIEEGTALGVTGTPSFYVNGRMLVGAQPHSAFKQAVERELARRASR